MEKRIYYLSNTVIPNTKRETNIHVFNVFTQVGVKQLTDFLRTVTEASNLVDCTLVNCDLRPILICPSNFRPSNFHLFVLNGDISTYLLMHNKHRKHLYANME